MARFAPLLWEIINQQSALLPEQCQTSPFNKQRALSKYPSRSCAFWFLRLLVPGGHWRKSPRAQRLWPENWSERWDCCHDVTVHRWITQMRNQQRILTESWWKQENVSGGFKCRFQNKPGWKCLNLKFQSAALNRIIAMIKTTLPWLLECGILCRGRDAAVRKATLLHSLYETRASLLWVYWKKTCPQVRWGKKKSVWNTENTMSSIGRLNF